MFASGPCHLLCDPPYVPLGSTCTCRMDPTSTLLSAGAHSGSVPGFKEYGSWRAEGLGTQTAIILASSLNLLEGRDSLAFELCSPTPTPRLDVTQAVGGPHP